MAVQSVQSGRGRQWIGTAAGWPVGGIIGRAGSMAGESVIA
jgi:hypothetical protein